jgi:large subunit ribosomal protein L15
MNKKVALTALTLNTLSPSKGSKQKAKRLGRGPGSGTGKTSGKGHKGQKSRSGGGVRIGFEGGQMPLKMRLPKFGFTSQKSLLKKSLRLSDLNKIADDSVDLVSLKAANLITHTVETVKIYLSGEIKKPLTIRGAVRVSKGARAAILAAGGQVEAVAE